MFWKVHRTVIGSRYIHVYPPSRWSPWSLKPEKTVKTDRDKSATVLPPEGAGSQTTVASDVSDREWNHTGPPFQKPLSWGREKKARHNKNTLVLFFIDMYNKKNCKHFHTYIKMYFMEKVQICYVYNTQQLCIVNKKTLSITWHECQ